MARNSSNTAFIVLGPEDLARLPEWHAAATRRFAGSKIHPVIIGGEKPSTALRYTHFATPNAAALAMKSHCRPQDTLCVLAPSMDDELFVAFSRASLLPRVVETRRHGPAAWAPERKAG